MSPEATVDRDVEIGLLLPTSEPPVFDDPDPLGRLVELAKHAEQAGFESIWAGESLQSPRFEPLAVLAAIAAVTDRARLGTASMIPAYRQPVATAQQIASLDRLTQGRLLLGVGAGYPSPKTKAAFGIAGADYHRRFSLLDDITKLWRAMWAGATTFDGALLRLSDLPPARAHSRHGPPLWLASGTPQGLIRAARHYDGWLPYPTDADRYAAGWRELTASALTAARPPAAIAPALFVTVLVTDDQERGEADLDAYCRATYGMPMSVIATIQLLLVGQAADIATTLSRYVGAGARHLVVRVGSLDPGDQPERIADALAPVREHTSP